MINIGLSSYSMSRALSDGRMNIGQVIDYVAENKGGHIEIVPGGVLTLNGNDELTAEIVQRAKDAGIAISSYTIGANFAVDTAEEVRKEVDRVKTEIDVAAKLGVTRMRHDAGWCPIEKARYAT